DLENTLQHNIDLPGRVWVENLSTSQTAAGKVYLNRPALVILKTNYHPNWRAWINEAPADVLRVTPGFAAIECPSGEHGVTFRYEGSQAKGILFVIGLLFPLLVISANRILRQPDEN
ncbi:MAG: hypothetical protein DCC75_13410, partial [Proteobacteria bacterium]